MQVQAPASAALGRIQSREDVARAIDSICEYYARHEPGSPVPLALTRAKTWVTMSFLDVLKDISPGSVGEAERVLALKAPGD